MKRIDFNLFPQVKIPSEFQEAFNHEIERINIKSAQVVSIWATFLFLGFFFTGIDYLYDPTGYISFFYLRTIISLLTLSIYILTHNKKLKRYGSVFSSTTLILCGFGISIMIRKLGGYQTEYYAGLLLVYLSTLPISCSTKITAYICLSTYSFYIIPALIFDIGNDFDLRLFVSNNAFQIWTIIDVLAVKKFMINSKHTEILNRLKIQHQSKAIHEQADILTQQKEELSKSIEIIKEQEQAKKNYIANITHDLKTPLSVISGHAEMLQKEFNDNSDLSKNTYFINDAVHKTTRLLDVLVSISNLENEKNKPNLELYDLTTFIKEYIEQFMVLAKKGNIDLNLEYPSNRLVIHSDIMWMERIVDNLVQNAFKFTPSGGRITIKLYSKAQKIFLEIIDTGCGVPKHKLPYIFERKYQAHDEKNKEGYGLGLSIVKEMVDILGCKIKVESEVDKGTTFRIELLPYVDQQAPVKNEPFTGKNKRSGLDRRKDDRIARIKKDVEHDMQMKAIEVDVSKYENKSPDKATILLAEDSEGQIHLLIEALKDHFNLIFASNGKEALAKLEQYKHSVDLILSDVKMPEMDGLDLCKNVFTQEEYKHIPFIFITAFHNTDEQLKGLSFGATDYLQKPFHTRILLEKLNHWISRREYEKYLIQITEILEHKNRNLTKLRSFINHEVRNPLMAVSYVKRGFDQLKEKYYDASNEKNKEIWNRVSHLDTTMKTIHDVLETSKVIEDEFNTGELKEIPINSLIDDALVQTEHLMNGVSLIHDKDSAPHDKISCDHRMITQIFVNIIRNAVEAIREKQLDGGKIDISYMILGNNVNIKVKDNGIGMTKEQKDNIFAYKFTTKKDGTGVGLHLSHKMIKVLGGGIAVSTEKNIGSEFVISLPLVKTLD